MKFEIKTADFVRLENAMQAYEGNVESVVNDVLHNQAGKLLHDEIMLLMPTSEAKKKHASKSKSLQILEGNLSVTVATKKAFNYLYFPDDGTNTQRHIGYKGVPREFFPKGAENKTEEIINLCIGRLVNSFENATN